MRNDRQGAGGEAGERCQVVGAVGGKQDLVVTGDQLVDALIWFRFGVLGPKDAGNRLLFEPFPYVALVGAGLMGESFAVEGSSFRAA